MLSGTYYSQNYASIIRPTLALNVWVRAGAYKRRYPKGWSRTCYQECGCHLINFLKKRENLTACRKGLQRFVVIVIMQWQKRIIIVQKLTLVVELWALLSPRCPPSLERTIHFIDSVALRKDPRIFCPHRSDRCRTLMLKCRNSPLWQCCERWNNVLSPFWPPWSNHWTACHHVTCALIGTRHKLTAYNYTSSLALWTTLEYELVDANGVCQGIQKVRVEPATRSAVATCYTPGRGKIVPRNVNN